jgi:uncharacterized protein (TIRG00374 family)
MTSSAKHSRLGLVVNACLVALALTLLGLVIWQNREKIGEVVRHRLDLRLLALGLVIYQISLLISYVRWYLLVRDIEPGFKLRDTMLLGCIGYVFGLVIPGPVGGDFIKAAYLARMQIRRTQAIASMLIDRILGLLGLFSLAAGAGVLTWGVASPDVRKLILAAWAALGLSLLVLAAIFGNVLHRFVPQSAWARRKRLYMIMAELEMMSTTYRRRLDVVAVALGLSMVGHALSVLAFFTVGKMLFPTEMTTTLAQYYFVVPLTLFSTIVPLPFGALGLTEGVGDQLFRLVGHPCGALNMMGFRVLTYGCGLIAACVYLVKLSEVRALTAAVHNREDESRARESNLVDDVDLNSQVQAPVVSRTHLDLSGTESSGTGAEPAAAAATA